MTNQDFEYFAGDPNYKWSPSPVINYTPNLMACIHGKWAEPHEWKDPFTHKTLLLQKCEHCNLVRVVYFGKE